MIARVDAVTFTLKQGSAGSGVKGSGQVTEMWLVRVITSSPASSAAKNSSCVATSALALAPRGSKVTVAPIRAHVSARTTFSISADKHASATTKGDFDVICEGETRRHTQTCTNSLCKVLRPLQTWLRPPLAPLSTYAVWIVIGRSHQTPVHGIVLY